MALKVGLIQMNHWYLGGDNFYYLSIAYYYCCVNLNDDNYYYLLGFGIGYCINNYYYYSHYDFDNLCCN